MKGLAGIIILLVAMMVYGEKYALIYSPVKENVSVVKQSWTLDVKDMEIVWKATFLKWEEFLKSGYKPKNIYVFYGDGIDCYRYFMELPARYTPEQFGFPVNYKITSGKANGEELESIKEKIIDNLKPGDFLRTVYYDGKSFIEN